MRKRRIYFKIITTLHLNEFDLDPSIATDWQGICEEFYLTSGDITPEQHFRYGNAIDTIREVVEEYIKQNRDE